MENTLTNLTFQSFRAGNLKSAYFKYSKSATNAKWPIHDTDLWSIWRGWTGSRRMRRVWRKVGRRLPGKSSVWGRLRGLSSDWFAWTCNYISSSVFWKASEECGVVLVTILWRKRTMHPEKIHFLSSHSWPSAKVRCFFSSPFHTHPLWECVWKEEEKSNPTPSLCQEREEGNVFFLGALSVFSTWG